MSTAQTYSFTPTVGPGLANAEDDMWVETLDPGVDIEAHVIAYCRERHFTGAHVLAGGNGAEHDPDTGYETNYCGWIDAR